LVGQINGVAVSAFINCVNCASEYDSIDRKFAGDCGIIEVVADVAVSWAWARINPVTLATPKRAAITSGFFGNVFI
jgi:hypothetical protein